MACWMELVNSAELNTMAMARVAVICMILMLVCLVAVNSAPQRGGAFSQASAKAGSFGSRGPANGPRGFGPGRGSNRGGGINISVAKSVSISRGGAGGAQSSAQAGARG
ncbi:H/ACA ribonucleoprotein complex subunit GAR1-like [Leguminivora glycinivorella]|uniref:H/ACA ribonucleoprotein complex subunit GAR1-like n=1 Tax=Leguminivora glycinivorella TaxID=1035111 RepID=UPI00200FFCB0|nr:H/ACA ribonucleoprotein complex subunit GAR1-like [Leguminivora glycinivorella]